MHATVSKVLKTFFFLILHFGRHVYEGAIALPAPPPLATLLEATHNLYCIFATLSVPLQVVAREDKQYGTMYLIPYLKDYRNELP